MIRNAMAVVVVTTKAEVNPAHKCQGLVNDDYLLMMRPEEHVRLDVIWVAKYLQDDEKLE